MSDPKNPPAFPVSNSQGAYGREGMTLRDYFAAAALTGLMMKDPYAPPERHAGWAYSAADAMLAESAKGPTRAELLAALENLVELCGDVFAKPDECNDLIAARAVVLAEREISK